MSKKIFTVVFAILALLFCSSFVFANNNLGEELKDSWNKTEESMHNVGSAIGNTTHDIMNGTNNNNNNDNNDNNNNNNTRGIMGMSANNDGGYTTTRTGVANAATNTGLNSVAWTWIILAVTAVVIVSLIWYYANQENHTRVKDEQNQ